MIILRSLIFLNFLSMSFLQAEPSVQTEESHEDVSHYICIGIDNLGEAYEIDFYLEEDDDNIWGTWKGANTLHFQGKGLRLDDADEIVFHFSSRKKDESFEGMQHYTLVDDSYLFGSWNAWDLDSGDKPKSKVFGKETCLKVS